MMNLARAKARRPKRQAGPDQEEEERDPDIPGVLKAVSPGETDFWLGLADASKAVGDDSGSEAESLPPDPPSEEDVAPAPKKKKGKREASAPPASSSTPDVVGKGDGKGDGKGGGGKGDGKGDGKGGGKGDGGEGGDGGGDDGVEAERAVRAVRVDLEPRCPAVDVDLDVPEDTSLKVYRDKGREGVFYWHAQLPKRAWGFENKLGGACKRNFPHPWSREAAWAECKAFLLRAQDAGAL